MTDGQFLALLFIGLYLLDCLRWSPPHCRVFTRWWGRKWRATSAKSDIVLAGVRPTILNPLPNLGDHLSPDEWPVLPTPEGLHRINRDGRVLGLIPWKALQIKREPGGKKISLGKDYPALHFGSCSGAARWEAVLSALQKGEPIPADFREDYFSVERAKGMIKRLRVITTSVRAWAIQVWLLCALALPVTIWLLGTHIVTLVSFAFLFIATTAVAVAYYRASGRLEPEFRQGRGANAFVLALVPFHAIRACDLIGGEIAGHFHPITVAAATLDEEHFKTYASTTWRNWNYGVSPRPQFLIDGIEAVSAQRGLSLADLNAPPTKPDNSSRSYCPRCHTTFTDLPQMCPDCTEVQPEPFRD